MAYLKKSLEDEGVKNVAQTIATPAQANAVTRGTTGQTSTIQPGQTAGQAPGAAASGPSPTGYIPLQQYLQANVGAGAGTANVLGSQIQKAKQGSEAEITNIKSAGEEAGKKAQESIGAKGQELAQAISAQPTANIESAKQFLSESYSGPEVTPYAAQLSAAKEAAQKKLGLLKTAEGKQSALEESVKGAYGKGYGSLDRYLLATDPAAKVALEAQQKTAEKTVGDLGTAAESAIKTQIDLAKEKLKTQQTGLKQTAKEKQQAQLGSAQNKLERLDTTKYKFEDAAAPSYGDVLSEQQAADLRALSDLSGEAINQDLTAKTYREGRAPTPKGGFEQQAPGQIPAKAKEKADIVSKLKKEVGKIKLPGKIKI